MAKPERDLKKIKYWLKIALNMSTQLKREDEFFEFLKIMKQNGKEDHELIEMLEASFPLSPEDPN